MNIYAKLTLLCLSLVLFSAAVLSFFADRQVEQTLREGIVSSITQQAEEVSTDIGRFISSRLNDIRMSAKNPFFTITDIDAEENIVRLQELENLSDLYYSFSLFDNNRVRKADSKRLSIGKQHSPSIYWEGLMNGEEYVMDISTSESVGRVVMHFASKVRDINSNQEVGVLVGRILVNELFDVVGDFSLSADSSRRLDIHLISDDGTVLYSNTNPQAMLVEKYEKYDLISNLTAPGVNRVEDDGTLYFVSNRTKSSTTFGNNWTLVLSISNEKAFAPLAKIREQIIWAVLPVIGLSIIFALIAANVFVRPIVRLSNAAKEIGKGNLTVEIPQGSKDEVGTLAKQLSETSQILIKRIEQQKMMNSKLQDQKGRIEKQNSQLEHVTKQITDSISYAERIQRSTLPPLSTIQKVFPEAFVMYKPKDIIGGDFYWFESVRRGNNEYMIVACADCTGHGVPGAIMSIMGSNQLTNIIYYQNYLDPKKIVSRLDKVIKFELQSEHDDSTSRDGMEIGVCVIDLDSLRMEFAGAGIPLRLLKKGEKEMTIYKSPRLMVGGIEGDEQEVNTKLKKEVIQLEPGDKIYMSSDGYQDQFGGENDKKFMSKNFKKLLEDSSEGSMLDQKRTIERTFAKWTRNTSQTDDICVLGFEIK
ncbi:MAG: SpoIIE family protein phosphatase [Cyclobacteriaceae bacterium]